MDQSSDEGSAPGFWCLVYTKPRQERVALEHLNRQFSEAYLPTLATRKRINGTLKPIESPMFPRYIFLYMRPDIDAFGPIRSTRGASHLVRFGANVARVPDDFIELLKNNESSRTEAVPNSFKSGDKVAIAAGPFRGYEAIFECERAENRAIILLNLASRHTTLCIHQDDLGPID